MHATTTVFVREDKPRWFLGSASEYASLREMRDLTPLGSRKDFRNMSFGFLVLLAALACLPMIGLSYLGLGSLPLLLPLAGIAAVICVLWVLSRKLEHSTDNWPTDLSFEMALRRYLRVGLIDLDSLAASSEGGDRIESLILRDLRQLLQDGVAVTKVLAPASQPFVFEES